ncbi:hypothetical protein KP509_38G025900 [Ceratopteris richardii]|uniref:AT-hook motif nuclear-localized protein n=1 Tax=Ceratopteris richardii TaxID=49495 RepID=A0A8T2Q377_CERRI|nr:hypothetical protein KP509_38G025900 [Ceratopteris richardii]
MEGRESASPKTTHSYPPHGHEIHGPFGAYFRESGYPLMGGSPSIIHAPLAKRHNSATQPFSVISSSNPNPSSNLNSNPSPSANSVVPNLNPASTPNQNSASGVYFSNAEATGSSPSSALMVNLAERSLSDPVKKKRGRPRKYAKDENGVTVIISPSSLPASSTSTYKKKGSLSAKKAQLLALGTAGQHFTPHVLTVSAGEDVSTKIITFTSQGPWAVCILSANGAISNATLRHAGVSGGAVTYEGRFEILSLSGSFLLTESAGTRSRTGGLSVSLAGPDGRVIGGGVAGLLMAASPVQVVVGTFFTEIRKPSGSTEEAKLPGSVPVHTHAPAMPVMQQSRIDAAEPVQNPTMGTPGGQEVQPRIFQGVPLQAIDCFGNQFGSDPKGDTDPESTSPSQP